MLSNLNESALRDPPLNPEQLLTVLFAVAAVEGESLVVDVASAGHPAPLVRRADGSIERLTSAGPLIGLVKAPAYDSERVVLGRGDTMLLYTDGLTDARAPAEILDEEALVELLVQAAGLRGPELAAYLERSATAEQDPRDDIALLVLDRVAAS